MNFEELSDVDVKFAVPKRLHTLLGANGLPLRTPSNKQVGLSTSKSRLRTS